MTSLLKFLNNAYIAKDINVNLFNDVVANLNASCCLMFADDDLPSNGREHNTELHISIKCTYVTLAWVLVGTCSSLNMLPKTTLTQQNTKGVQMRPSALVVKAFDGSKRMVIRDIDLPILIGPQTFRITFQVMDIMPSYNCLLGRLWIHVAGVVTSSVYQKPKSVTSSKLVSISGEEDIFVSHLTSFRYIQLDEEIVETPLLALKVVNVVQTKPSLLKLVVLEVGAQWLNYQRRRISVGWDINHLLNNSNIKRYKKGMFLV